MILQRKTTKPTLEPKNQVTGKSVLIVNQLANHLLNRNAEMINNHNHSNSISG